MECKERPELWNVPMAVAGSVENRHGIILAKNEKAKALGIKTAETVWQAKQKCGGLVLVPPSHDKYMKYSKLVKAVYSRFTDQVEPFGIDECWLDVTGSTNLFGTGEQIAYTIKETVKSEIGLRISVGVSFNKVFAKLGSDLKKPDAVTAIPKDSYKEMLWHLPCEYLLGVGKATEKRLHELGILTIRDLAETDKKILRTAFGINGEVLWGYANGMECTPVRREDEIAEVKSMGHSITCVRDLTENDEVWRVLLSLCDDVSAKLREYGFKACMVAMSFKENTLFAVERQAALIVATDNALDLAKAAMSLFQKNCTWRSPIRAVGVRACRLVKDCECGQTSFYADARRIAKAESLDKTVDTVRKKYGKCAVQRASLMTDIGVPAKKDTDDSIFTHTFKVGTRGTV